MFDSNSVNILWIEWNFVVLFSETIVQDHTVLHLGKKRSDDFGKRSEMMPRELFTSFSRRLKITEVLYFSGLSRKTTIPSFWLIDAKISPSSIYTREILEGFIHEIEVEILPSWGCKILPPWYLLTWLVLSCLPVIEWGKFWSKLGYSFYKELWDIASQVRGCCPEEMSNFHMTFRITRPDNCKKKSFRI